MFVRTWKALAAFGGAALCLLLALAPCATAQSFLAEPAAGDPVALPVADEGVANDDYQQLLQRVQAAEMRIEQLESEHHVTTSLVAPGAPKEADAEKLATPTEDVRIATLEKAAADAAKKAALPAVKVSGFFHLDAGDFNQDAANVASLGDIQNGIGFRRARLGVNGNIAEFTGYYFEMDFAIAGRPSFTDVWGEQKELPLFGNVRIGQ